MSRRHLKTAACSGDKLRVPKTVHLQYSFKQGNRSESSETSPMSADTKCVPL